jgi:hypothetical protein
MAGHSPTSARQRWSRQNDPNDEDEDDEDEDDDEESAFQVVRTAEEETHDDKANETYQDAFFEYDCQYDECDREAATKHETVPYCRGHYLLVTKGPV